jgi:hypothetical protein
MTTTTRTAVDDKDNDDPIIQQFIELQERWGDVMLKTFTTPRQQQSQTTGYLQPLIEN